MSKNNIDPKMMEIVTQDDRMARKIHNALQIAFQYGQTDGDHHKLWCIDQMVRALTGQKYEQFVKYYQGELVDDAIEGEGYEYEWETGIAP